MSISQTLSVPLPGVRQTVFAGYRLQFADFEVRDSVTWMPLPGATSRHSDLCDSKTLACREAMGEGPPAPFQPDSDGAPSVAHIQCRQMDDSASMAEWLEALSVGAPEIEPATEPHLAAMVCDIIIGNARGRRWDDAATVALPAAIRRVVGASLALREQVRAEAARRPHEEWRDRSGAWTSWRRLASDTTVDHAVVEVVTGTVAFHDGSGIVRDVARSAATQPR